MAYHLPICRPSLPPLDSFAAAFSECLRSGQVTNYGPHVQRFEAALDEYLKTPTLAFSSGTAALITMLRAAGVNGGEVICPSYTFPATPHAIVWAEAKPIFADIDPTTLTLDPFDVARKITDATRAILGVDPYGVCCDYKTLQELARSNDIHFLMDSAPAFGSLVNGKPTGRFADASVFSFHATKPFSTMEGGALCSSNQELMDAASKIRNFGLEGMDGDCSSVGLNGKMMEVCALIGMRQFGAWERHARHRRSVAKRMIIMLRGIRGLSVPSPGKEQEPIWTYLPILIDADEFGMSRGSLMEALKEDGIEVRKYYTQCDQMSAYRDQRAQLPRTQNIASRVIALPLYNDMTVAEVEYVATTIRKIQCRRSSCLVPAATSVSRFVNRLRSWATQ